MSMEKNQKTLVLPGNGKKRELFCQVMLSPLAGVSDCIFRSLVRRWAPDALLFTEMVSATSLNLGHGIEKVARLSEEEGPVGVQLFDFRPEAIAIAAREAEAAGAFLIDINMGCPVRKVAKKGGGSGLLRNPELAAKIVSKVAESVSIPVTVKTRLGWCKDSADPIKFALKLQKAGAQLITLHGRTREQGFSGIADWTTISNVKEALDIPLIANGDINNPDDAFRCLKVTKADGLMIGRGSLGAPWIIGQINSALKGQKILTTPSPLTRMNIAREHLLMLLDKKGEHGLLIARKHMNWTCKGFQGATRLRKQLLQAQTSKKAMKILEEGITNLG